MTIFEGRPQQWRNMSFFLSKEKSEFIKFDIVDFYPSITEELLIKSLNYAKSIKAIDENVVKVIMRSLKSLLFDRDNVKMSKKRKL